MLVQVPVVSHYHKTWCCTSFQSSWPSEWNGTIDCVISIMSCQCQCQWHHMTGKVMLDLILIVMTLQLHCYLWYHWHHGCHTAASGITWSKSFVAPHFICLEVTNAIVPLTMPSAPCDANASTKCITWPKRSCCTSLQLSWPNKCHDAVAALMMPLALHDANLVPVAWHDQKSHVVFNFNQLCNKLNSAIDETVGIMWH